MTRFEKLEAIIEDGDCIARQIIGKYECDECYICHHITCDYLMSLTQEEFERIEDEINERLADEDDADFDDDDDDD